MAGSRAGLGARHTVALSRPRRVLPDRRRWRSARRSSPRWKRQRDAVGHRSRRFVLPTSARAHRRAPVARGSRAHLAGTRRTAAAEPLWKWRTHRDHRALSARLHRDRARRRLRGATPSGAGARRWEHADPPACRATPRPSRAIGQNAVRPYGLGVLGDDLLIACVRPRGADPLAVHLALHASSPYRRLSPCR